MKEFGILYNEENLKLQRNAFNEMLRLVGIQVIHYAPRPGKHYTTYAEIKTNFEDPVVTGCIFEEHPTQKTMKKLGWNAEQQEEASLISVPYDLANVQAGSIFVLPSGIDNAQGRLFRVVDMSTIMMSPACITCKLVPEWESRIPEAQQKRTEHNFNLLCDTDEDE